MMIRRRVLVTGRVQGVGFRASTAAEVERRAPAAAGFVRNLVDGRVEAVFQGERDAVLDLVAWCEHGPVGAEVERIEVVEETVDPAERRFSIRRK